MRSKHWRKLFKVSMAYFIIYMSGSMPVIYGAASGNYSDLLPPGAAGNTTVISNGSGWSLTTLAPSQTFGDALSRAPMTVYQSTSAATVATSILVSTMTGLIGQGSVGSTTFPALWVATGRSIRVTVRGFYGTTGAPTWTWGLMVGTTTILTTGAVTAVANQSNQAFSATGLITVAATGGSGSANAFWDIYVSSGGIGNAALNFSTTTASATSIDWTSQLIVRPTFKWGTSSGSNTITINQAIVEFLN